MLGLRQRRKGDPPAGGTSADISGSVSESQLAIGDHIVQNNISAGAIIHQVAAERAPRPPRARAKPVSVKPREAPHLVGRVRELEAARAALASCDPVQFSGRSGSGKTALLRHFAHRTSGDFPDGVIYYRSRSESLDDLLMRIFEFLYESEARLKPTNAELCLYLERTQALLLLDDVDIEREDLETLLSTLPRSVFVFGSPERSLWDEGTAIALRGLGDDAALVLVEQYLGRPLASDEHADFATLCRALDGQPLQIIKAVTQVHDEDVPASELVPSGSPFPSAPEQLSAQMVHTLTPEARQALMLMAALGGAPLHVDHVAALTGSQDSAAMLADLEQRGLAKSHSPRYSATAPLAALRTPDGDALSRTQLLSYFTGYAETNAAHPERLRDDLEPILATLRAGAAAGDWRGVLRLARAADDAAASSKLWGVWGSLLDIALDAARHLVDEAQEAWALHQLGTRALCIGDTDEARRRLAEALRIREQIGDRAAEITRHNMGHLPGAPPPPSKPPAGPSRSPAWVAPLCVGIVAMVGVAGIISPSGGDEGPRASGPSVASGDVADPRTRAGDPRARAADAPRRHSDAPRRMSAATPLRPADVASETRGVPASDPVKEGVGETAPGMDPAVNPDDDELPPLPPAPQPVPRRPAPDPGVTPPPAPPPAPTATPVACPVNPTDIVGYAVQEELAALQPPLTGYLDQALPAQVTAVQNVFDQLGDQCSPSQAAAIIRAAATR